MSLLRKTSFLYSTLLCVFLLPCITYAQTPLTCSYNTYQWDTKARKAVNIKRVVKPYHQLSAEEIHRPTGCSVCEEDQQLVKLKGIKPFRVCRYMADDVTRILRDLLAFNEPIKTVTAYRVGKTRGDTDVNGLRTQFSNHAYGIALDINAAHNGLYDQCEAFSPSCRLIRGGQWSPEHPQSLTRKSAIVALLRSIGLRWGGDIKGRQKDFMHFSPSGY